MIQVDEAKNILWGALPAPEVEEVGLEDAQGRVLAAQTCADRDFPPTDRSAMDGFAVRTVDLPEPDRVLRIAGEIRAGEAVGGARVKELQAIRIMTGAIVPPGADAVVMVEMTEPGDRDGTVRIREKPEPGQHIRNRAEDLTRGDEVLAAGRSIHPPQIAALASVGATRVPVFRRPDVRVLSTGDEIVEPGSTPAAHQVRNSNARTLLAQLRSLGIEGRYLGIASDETSALREALEVGLAGEVLLLTGGVSMGEYDLVGSELDALGVEQLFHKVAIRPGKPMLVGRRGRCIVIGLPGNPVSAFTGFAVFVAPALRRMTGLTRWDNLDVVAHLAEPLRPKPGRTTYHLADLALEDGKLTARPVRTMGSGDVLSMAQANGFVISQPGRHALPAGTLVPAVLWPETFRP